MKLASKNQELDINTAKEVINAVGISNYYYVGYSDANGVSVYFRDSKGTKIRVSDHSVTNNDRMKTEILLSFDAKMIGLGGKESFRDNSKINKFIARIFGY